MNHCKVLIVGAGIAGISAAARLLENNISNIIILEAENRIGGRVFTTNFGNSFVELGAQWIHGEKNNVVYQLANAEKLTSHSDINFENSHCYSSSGTRISNEIRNTIFGIYWTIMQRADHELKTFSGSLGEYFTKEYYKEIEESKTSGLVSEELSNQILAWLEKLENSIDASDSWFETSGQGHLDYWDCDGFLLTKWNSGGYRTLLDILMKRIPNPKEQLPVISKTLLNKEVKHIHWKTTTDSNIVVDCTDGTKFTAEQVLVTVSLGVLKEKAEEIFIPALPHKKLNAIKGLGFGTVDKIFLKFPSQWWPNGMTGFSFIWTDNDKKAFSKNKGLVDKYHWATEVIGFYLEEYEPMAMMGWILGPAAREMENCSNEEVIDICLELLNKFVGHEYKIPKPDDFIRTQWYSNPRFRGSYSCRYVKSDELNALASHLAEPVYNEHMKPVLLFAGEATHEHFFSTVHGAVESGWREADRVLSNLNPNHIYDVIVVGGGISGLAAIKTFFENNIKNFKLLEAQDYIGGRVKTVEIEGEKLELGAQWIHGENNPIYNLSKENNLLWDKCSSEGEGIYLREGGEVIPKEVIDEVYEVVDAILEKCENYVDHKLEDVPGTIGEILYSEFEKYLKSCHDSDDIILIKKELFQWHLNFHVIDNGCSDLNKLSAKQWGSYEKCAGKDYNNFTNGFSSLVSSILNEISSDKIVLNSPVLSVEWKDEAHIVNEKKEECFIKINCSDKIYRARYVVITYSLGCLKNNYSSFQPPLPLKHIQAIENMGFGLLDKLFLVFDVPWWSPDTKGFQLVWSHTNSVNHSNQPSWVRDITGFDVLVNHPNVLLGWIGGSGAEIMEQMNDTDVMNDLVKVLKYFTNNHEIPKPTAVLRSQWLKNPYIRGGYSHTTSKCDELNIKCSDLLEPVFRKVVNDDTATTSMEPVLLFAGEALHQSYFSTTHGAYLTGEKQAHVIIDHMFNKLS